MGITVSADVVFGVLLNEEEQYEIIKDTEFVDEGFGEWLERHVWGSDKYKKYLESSTFGCRDIEPDYCIHTKEGHIDVEWGGVELGELKDPPLNQMVMLSQFVEEHKIKKVPTWILGCSYG